MPNRPAIVFFFSLLSCGFGADAVERPNILFILADDLGARLGIYGDPNAKTPHLDALAKRGVWFERAYCQRPTCGPSRASMLTGLYQFESGLSSQKVTPAKSRIPCVSLPSLFRQSGYTTARVGKVFHMGVPGGIGEPGSDEKEAWDIAINNSGWDGTQENYEAVESYGSMPNVGVRIGYSSPDLPNKEMADGVATVEALRLMEEQHPEKTGKPLMLFVGYYRPHPPMIAPKKHWDAIAAAGGVALPEVPENDREDIPKSAFFKGGEASSGFNFVPEKVAKDYTHGYYASLNFVDEEVGKLLAGLEQGGLAENTIVVFAGDQGFHLGEHHHWHKTTLFEEGVRVPLIVEDPRIESQGNTALGISGLIDIYPTLCELTGVEPRHQLSGKSLVPLLQDPSLPGKDWELTETRSQYGLRTPTHRFSDLGGGDYMLYDHVNDREEFTNLASDPEHAETLRELKELLKSILE